MSSLLAVSSSSDFGEDIRTYLLSAMLGSGVAASHRWKTNSEICFSRSGGAKNCDQLNAVRSNDKIMCQDLALTRRLLLTALLEVLFAGCISINLFEINLDIRIRKLANVASRNEII